MQARADDVVLQWSGQHSLKLSQVSLYTLFDLLVTKCFFFLKAGPIVNCYCYLVYILLLLLF